MSRIALSAAFVLALTGALFAAWKWRVPDIDVQQSYELGTVKLEEMVSVEVPLRNRGRKALAIRSVAADCGCTAALSAPVNIAPGGEVVLAVECDPSHPEPALGRTERLIYITSDDPDENDVEVKLVLEIMP